MYFPVCRRPCFHQPQVLFARLGHIKPTAVLFVLHCLYGDYSEELFKSQGVLFRLEPFSKGSTFFPFCASQIFPLTEHFLRVLQQERGDFCTAHNPGNFPFSSLKIQRPNLGKGFLIVYLFGNQEVRIPKAAICAKWVTQSTCRFRKPPGASGPLSAPRCR